ncbi:MAG TPA: beta-galactosidase [Candidatus Jeotgalibaca pullicola]|nr:beta-galactosidase [Candidatus Jeotgalibaca pullicola]
MSEIFMKEKIVTLNEEPTILFSKEIHQEEMAHKGIAVRIHNKSPYSLTLDMKFISSEKKTLTISFNILPSTDVTVPIPFLYLNSQTLFPKRTKGRLRMMVNGTPMRKDEVKEIVLSSRACHIERQIILKEIALTNQVKEGHIHDPEVLIDQFGQWKNKEWEGKTIHEENLRDKLNQHLQFTSRSEEKEYSADQSNWFRVEKKDGKWYFIDPENKPFLSIGMDCVRPSVDCFVDPVYPFLPEDDRENTKMIDYCQKNLELIFGKEWRSKWDELIIGYLRKWGINTIGNWSDFDFIQKAKIPYVLPLDVYSEVGYPSTKAKIFRDFPDVFSPEFEKNTKIYANALNSFKDDPMLIGYFMRNEPEWAFEYDVLLAEELFGLKEQTYTKQAFIAYLESKYTSIEDLSKAWKLEAASNFDAIFTDEIKKKLHTEAAQEDLHQFSKEMIRQYVSIPAQACKKIDEHHLNLGMRYAYIANESMLAGSENFDVFSINCYQEDPTDKINQVAELTGLPVMIGEFHFGALDKGLSSTGIKGCLTQKDRALAYNYYFEKAALHPNFIGAHYFSLYDQSCLGRFDGENYQFGFLDICSNAYEEFTKEITVSNENLLAIHMEEHAINIKRPSFIPPIYC